VLRLIRIVFAVPVLPVLCALLVGVSGGELAVAEEPAVSAADIQAVLKRLEETEKQVQKLQDESREIRQEQTSKSRQAEESIPLVLFEPKEASNTGAAQYNSSDASDFESKHRLVSAAAPVDDRESDPPSLVEQFEKRWEEQDAFNADLESAFEKVVHPGTSLGTMKVAGRVHLDHWAFPGESPGVNAFETGDSTNGPQDRFQFRRMRFGVRGDVWENMEYRIEMEFAGGDDSQFRDVWIGFNHLPILQTVLIGNQKRPYGLDHMNSSRNNVFIERPFVVEATNQDARRVGIQSYGVSDDEAYNWRFGIFNQQLIQNDGSYISDHYQAQVAGRFANTIWYDECSNGRGYAHWAVSGTAAHPDGSTPLGRPIIGPEANEARFRTRPEARSSERWLDTGRIAGADWYELLGLEAVMNVGPFQVVGEYQNIWLQRDAGFGRNLQFQGGYAYLSYFLTGEHIPWERRSGTLGRVKPFENFFIVDRCCGDVGSGWGAWQVALRWSYADFTDDDVYGGVGESLTFGLNWHWNSNARMQFNYIYGDISDRNVTDVNGLTFTDGHYQILGTRFMVDF